jgi:NADPH-dependent 2,4-dienoyl-CoA reductase/sulfur reductase-like enzyme/bacterioferritin-associated ferredoxin
MKFNYDGKAKYHVVVVGSGIGGLSAANTLSGHGLDILLIDENAHPGGQLLRKSETSSKKFFNFKPDKVKIQGFSLIQKTRDACSKIDRIHLIQQAQVLGIFKDRRLLIHIERNKKTNDARAKKEKSGQIIEVQADHLILATGSRERYLPFKGWTLPGVMSLGAAQILMKSYGVLPAFHTVIAGSSPLMMVLASEILSNKGKVTAVLDENPFRKKLDFLPLIQHHWPKLLEGAFYTAQMMCNRVPMVNQTRVIEAKGKENLESVIVAKTTLDGHVITGTETEYPAQALTIGYGFIPNIELAVQAGCDIEYQPTGGGWIVTVDENLESSVNSIYAVGEITGIAGGKKSYIQGKLAAISVLKKLDKLNFKKKGSFLLTQVKQLHSLNHKQTAYAAFLNHLCRIPPVAYSQIPDDTLICRCENITMGAIKKAIDQDFITSGGIKKATRCGMGRCQGRICGTILSDIIMALTKKKPYDIGPSLSRAPVKNVAISSFLDQPI